MGNPPCRILITVTTASSPTEFQGRHDQRQGLYQRARRLQDHSSRETLADYGDHRFRLLYRDANGLAEEHDKIVDVVVVHSGEGALMLGGTMSGKKGSAATGEYLGSALTGGEVHPLAAGDIVRVPAGIPHSFLVPAGKHITYVLLKFPAKGQ